MGTAYFSVYCPHSLFIPMDSTPDNETFQILEEKIQQTVALVQTLREQNANLTAQLKTIAASAGVTSKQKEDFEAALAKAHKQTEQAKTEAEQARGEAKKLQKDVDQLQTERKQVRSRVEKILNQIDQLAGQ